MLRPVASRLPLRTKPFPYLTSPLSSHCIAPVSPRITPSITRQRRDSSSKPSSSAPPSGNDSTVSATPDPATPRKKGSFSKAGSRVKVKDSVENSSIDFAQPAGSKEEAYAIPSVPSTQHLHLQDVHLASLFAFHRPISVHHSMPQTVSNKQFDQIFTTRPPPSPKQYGDVISTISTTVSNILKTIEKNGDLQNGAHVVVSDSSASANAIDHKQDPNYISSNGTPVYIDVEAFVRRLPPYMAPPAPKKASSRKQKAHRASKTAKMDEFFTASPVEMIEVFEPTQELPVQRVPVQPFLNRLRVRNLDYLERNRETILAISVKRQRKLKMKKHKYKKLMRRTRNLRRRQDRL